MSFGDRRLDASLDHWLTTPPYLDPDNDDDEDEEDEDDEDDESS